MADTSETSSTWGGLIEMPQHQVIQVALLGIGLGIGAWILGMLVKQVVIMPLFCGDPTNGVCVGSVDVSSNAAAVIVGFVGLMALVRLSVFRPLLVVLATLVALWGIGSSTNGLQWYESLAWTVVLYMLCYIAFAWLVRPRSFVPTLLLLVIAVSLIRWLPAL
jgi:hypothetical protein